METTQELREQLAEYAHEAWSGWMNYLLSKSKVNDEGTWTIPAQSAERWYRQMTTPYHLLPENEKASDRDEADKMLKIVFASQPVSTTAGALAIAMLQRTLDDGRTIELPSIGIVILPDEER